jgi:peptidoglycan hydrolase-like protein with peptidoglycan-binding domain
MRITRWKLGLGALVAGASLLLTTAPAQAAYPGNSGAYGTTFVDGDDKVTDDFGDHFAELGNSLCYGCGESSNTDIVFLWQSILASEHLLDLSEIDGQFGPRTRDATIAWQKRYDLTADGKVGDATWSKADDRLKWSGSVVLYVSGGPYGYVTFHRGDSSKPQDGGAYHLAQVKQGDGYRIPEEGTRVYHRARTISWY